MATETNWKGVAFYIIIAAAIIVAIAYFAWPNGIIHVTLAGLFSGVQLPKIDLGGLFTWMKDNAVVAGLIASLGTTAIGAFIKNYQTGQVNKALDSKLLELEKKNLALVNDTSAVDALQAKIKELESDTTASDLQKRINDFDSILTNRDATIASLLKQNKELMDRLEATPVKIVKAVV